MALIDSLIASLIRKGSLEQAGILALIDSLIASLIRW
jgi:hypothetical protein